MVAEKTMEYPASRDYEEAIANAIILYPDIILELIPILKPRDFWYDELRAVYQAAIKLSEERAPIGLLSINDKMAGERMFLGDPDFVVPRSSVEWYANHVRRLSICRQGILIGREAISKFMEAPEDPSSVVGDIGNRLISLTDRVHRKDPAPSAIIERLMATDMSKGISIGKGKLAFLTNGLQPGTSWTLGGFSSTGKTAFALQLMLDAIRIGGAKAAYFSLEMSQEQLILRLLSNISGVPMRAIAMNQVSMEQYPLLTEAQQTVADWKDVWFYDDLYQFNEIANAARKHKLRSGLDVVIIDYLQNIVGKGETMDVLSHAAVMSLKLAKELNATVVCLSQISNAEAKDGNFGDNDSYTFKGSGAIRDSADVNIVLTRKREAQRDLPIHDLKAVVKKNRQGPIGSVEYQFEMATGRIWEVERPQF